MADDGVAHPAPQRSYARHRRRHQAGDLSAATATCRRRGRDPVLFDRLRRADRLLRPSARDVRRRRETGARRRRDHRTRACQQRVERRRESSARRRVGGVRSMMHGDWFYRLREHKGTLLAFAAFVAMFAIYGANHPAGFSANVATTAANKGVLLAIVAIAQMLVVLTSGIDLSVGMVMVLANCLSSEIVVGSPVQTALGVVAVLVVGGLCGAINGLIVIYGRLQPIVTTIATGAVYYGAALALRPVPS